MKGPFAWTVGSRLQKRRGGEGVSPTRGDRSRVLPRLCREPLAAPLSPPAAGMASYQPCPATANEAPAQVLHAETSISLPTRLSSYPSTPLTAAWHLTCICPVTCPVRRKIDPGLFSSFTTSGCQSSRWVSTLCIKQDGPTHTQMSGNIKHAGSNPHPPGQAHCTERREKILTPSPKTTEILHIVINSSTGELHNAPLSHQHFIRHVIT